MTSKPHSDPLGGHRTYGGSVQGAQNQHKCPLCNGTGRKSDRFKMYHPRADQTCSKCKGTGRG